MRRTILGPVILCVFIIGLIGTDIGQTAQAKTHKADTRKVVAQESGQHKHAAGIEKKAVKGKKSAAHEKKSKAGLASKSATKQKKNVVHASKPKPADGKKLKLAKKPRQAESKKQKLAKKPKPAESKKQKLAKKPKPADGKKQKLAKKTKASGGKKQKVAKAAQGKKQKIANARHDRKGSSSVHGSLRKHTRSHPVASSRSGVRGRPQQVEQAQSLPEYQLHTPEPADYYLAKQAPDAIRNLSVDSGPEKRLPLAVRVLELAYRCLGIPYRHGGTTTQGFDCSGFVKYVFKENGIELGRSSRDQALDGKPVSLAEIRPGDLIFFRMHQRKKARSPIDHVGLYVGNGQFIHAASGSRAREIKVDSLDASHYLPKVVGARRVLNDGEGVDESLPN